MLTLSYYKKMQFQCKLCVIISSAFSSSLRLILMSVNALFLRKILLFLILWFRLGSYFFSFFSKGNTKTNNSLFLTKLHYFVFDLVIVSFYLFFIGNTNFINSIFLGNFFFCEIHYYMLIVAYYKKTHFCLNCVQILSLFFITFHFLSY